MVSIDFTKKESFVYYLSGSILLLISIVIIYYSFLIKSSDFAPVCGAIVLLLISLVLLVFGFYKDTQDSYYSLKDLINSRNEQNMGQADLIKITSSGWNLTYKSTKMQVAVMLTAFPVVYLVVVYLLSGSRFTDIHFNIYFIIFFEVYLIVFSIPSTLINAKYQIRKRYVGKTIDEVCSAVEGVLKGKNLGYTVSENARANVPYPVSGGTKYSSTTEKFHVYVFKPRFKRYILVVVKYEQSTKPDLLIKIVENIDEKI
jgi:hypothetical protein